MKERSLSLWRQIGLSLSSYGKAWDFIFRNGLWKFFFVSLLVSILIWVGGYFAIDWFTEVLSKWVTGIIYLLTGGLCLFGILYDFWTLNDQISVENSANRY